MNHGKGSLLAAQILELVLEERRRSSLAFAAEGLQGVYVVGAPEALQPALLSDADLGSQADGWAAQGHRVLLCTHHPEIIPFGNAEEEPQLPSDLIVLGLLILGDELRLQLAELLLEHYPEERAEALEHLDFAMAEFRDMRSATARQVNYSAEQKNIFRGRQFTTG